MAQTKLNLLVKIDMNSMPQSSSETTCDEITFFCLRLERSRMIIYQFQSGWHGWSIKLNRMSLLCSAIRRGKQFQIFDRRVIDYKLHPALMKLNRSFCGLPNNKVRSMMEVKDIGKNYLSVITVSFCNVETMSNWVK